MAFLVRLIMAVKASRKSQEILMLVTPKTQRNDTDENKHVKI